MLQIRDSYFAIEAMRYFASFTKVYDGAVRSTNGAWDSDGNYFNTTWGAYSIGYSFDLHVYYVEYTDAVKGLTWWYDFKTLMEAKSAIYRHIAENDSEDESGYLYIPEVEEEDPEDDWDYDFTTHEWCFQGFTVLAFWNEDNHKLSIHMNGNHAVLEASSIEEVKRIVYAIIDGDYTIDETPTTPYTTDGTLILKEDMDKEVTVKSGRKLRAPSREYRRNCKVKDRVPTKGTSCFRKGYHKYEKQWKHETIRSARHDAKKQCRI